MTAPPAQPIQNQQTNLQNPFLNKLTRMRSALMAVLQKKIDEMNIVAATLQSQTNPQLQSQSQFGGLQQALPTTPLLGGLLGNSPQLYTGQQQQPQAGIGALSSALQQALPTNPLNTAQQPTNPLNTAQQQQPQTGNGAPLSQLPGLPTPQFNLGQQPQPQAGNGALSSQQPGLPTPQFNLAQQPQTGNGAPSSQQPGLPTPQFNLAQQPQPQAGIGALTNVLQQGLPTNPVSTVQQLQSQPQAAMTG